jgi:hypothetical protein
MKRRIFLQIGPGWQELVRYAAIPTEDFNWCTEQVLFNPGDPKRERGVIVDAMAGRRIADKYNIELGRESSTIFDVSSFAFGNAIPTVHFWEQLVPTSN